MRPLRYSINLSLDGCCDHRGMTPDEESYRHSTSVLERADALLLGRVTYQMMEAAFRPPIAEARPDWMAPFARKINSTKKYVVSSTLASVDWNAELLKGDLRTSVQSLKDQPGTGIYVGGVMLPMALAELGLIDEYEFIIQPRIAGHGPTLFAGLRESLELELVERQELRSGFVIVRYVPRGRRS